MSKNSSRKTAEDWVNETLELIDALPVALPPTPKLDSVEFYRLLSAECSMRAETIEQEAENEDGD